MVRAAATARHDAAEFGRHCPTRRCRIRPPPPPDMTRPRSAATARHGAAAFGRLCPTWRGRVPPPPPDMARSPLPMVAEKGIPACRAPVARLSRACRPPVARLSRACRPPVARPSPASSTVERQISHHMYRNVIMAFHKVV